MPGRGPLVVALVVGALIVSTARRADADLVFLTTGRTLSVKSHQIDGDLMTVTLRAGGTMTLSRTAVERIAPDEVPYPEPTVPSIAEAPPIVPAAAPGLDRLRHVGSPSDPTKQHSLAVRNANRSGAQETKPYAELISTVATTHGVDAKLVHAVVEAESNYQAKARSPKGARGLMQLMPDTARQYAVRDPYDPKSNLDAGVRHLKDLLSRFDLRLALAAYNAGEAVVRRHGGMPPFAETKSYVQRILQRVGN